MHNANHLTFDFSCGHPLGEFNRQTMEMPYSSVAFNLLKRYCGVVPAASMICVDRVDGQLAMKMYFALATRGHPSPIYINGDDAHCLYSCIFAPGQDPLLPAIIEVQVTGHELARAI